MIVIDQDFLSITVYRRVNHVQVGRQKRSDDNHQVMQSKRGQIQGRGAYRHVLIGGGFSAGVQATKMPKRI